MSPRSIACSSLCVRRLALPLPRTTVWTRSITTTAPRPNVVTPFLDLPTLSIAATSLVTGAALAYRFSAADLLGLFQEKLPTPGTPEATEFTAKIERQLQDSVLVNEFRANPDYVEHRMWTSLPKEYTDQALLSGTLRGPGMFAVPGIVFVNAKDMKVVSFVHCGSKLCGFPGIVHGGMIAALLDESLARAAILPLPHHAAVTANLTVNYRSPSFANQIIQIETHVTEFADRKSLVEGKVVSSHGHLLAEASAVFVVPKKYKLKGSLANM
ncbi:HotDog domain-containing protein [Limtongia smithiae]|uniref:HotDog domain-containing protein n=1 Tax=Limtongia smithiae TaxID=1125753 RepID=UPI0034CF6F9F